MLLQFENFILKQFGGKELSIYQQYFNNSVKASYERYCKIISLDKQRPPSIYLFSKLYTLDRKQIEEVYKCAKKHNFNSDFIDRQKRLIDSMSDNEILLFQQIDKKTRKKFTDFALSKRAKQPSPISKYVYTLCMRGTLKLESQLMFLVIKAYNERMGYKQKNNSYDGLGKCLYDAYFFDKCSKSLKIEKSDIKAALDKFVYYFKQRVKKEDFNDYICAIDNLALKELQYGM